MVMVPVAVALVSVQDDHTRFDGMLVASPLISIVVGFTIPLPPSGTSSGVVFVLTGVGVAAEVAGTPGSFWYEAGRPETLTVLALLIRPALSTVQVPFQ
jgi:hypothetical protein